MQKFRHSSDFSKDSQFCLSYPQGNSLANSLFLCCVFVSVCKHLLTIEGWLFPCLPTSRCAHDE